MQLSPNGQQVIRTVCKRTKNIRKILGQMKTDLLAKKHKVMKRTARKCTVSDLLLSYWELVSVGQFSYDCWAARASELIGETISGQAICKRMNDNMSDFLKELLDKALALKSQELFDIKLFSSFGNVLIQDATHFNLPGSLAEYFPGSFSKLGASATAKIQAVFDLKKGAFTDLRIFSFRDNDQKDAPHIASMLNKGDLTIRDLGYCTLNAFSAIIDKGAHFLSRFKYGVNIFEPESGQQIDLLKYLKKHGGIDRQIAIGAKKTVLCRIVAVRLADKVAAERIRKAKADRNAKTNHKKEYYELLRYSIYITTVEQNIWSAQEVAQAYRCRWYIEILFKAWKSGLRMKFNIPQRYASQQRAMVFLYAGLLLVVLQVIPVFIEAQRGITRSSQYLSIIKICSFILQKITELNRTKRMDRLLQQVRYHCLYESRKDRQNVLEFMMPICC